MITLAYMLCFKVCLVMTSVFHLRSEEGKWCWDGTGRNKQGGWCWGAQGLSAGSECPQLSTWLCADFLHNSRQVT